MRNIHRRRALGWLSLAAAALLPAGGTITRAAAAEAPLVAAASDLQFALEEIAAGFRAETGDAVRLTFGSSGNFARQIRQGAPFELYLSADERYVLDLARDGFTRDEGALYALGRIVLAVPPGSPIAPDANPDAKPDGTLDGLARALEAGEITRFAIANPAHAPYGRRAEEALRHRGLWDALAPALVLGENVSQAAQFAVSGNAEGGIIAQSLALAPTLAGRAAYAPIPEAWHSPLRQRMALVKGAGPVAEAFQAYLGQPAARAILRRYGFALPGADG